MFFVACSFKKVGHWEVPQTVELGTGNTVGREPSDDMRKIKPVWQWRTNSPRLTSHHGPDLRIFPLEGWGDGNGSMCKALASNMRTGFQTPRTQGKQDAVAWVCNRHTRWRTGNPVEVCGLANLVYPVAGRRLIQIRCQQQSCKDWPAGWTRKALIPSPALLKNERNIFSWDYSQRRAFPLRIMRLGNPRLMKFYQISTSQWPSKCKCSDRPWDSKKQHLEMMTGWWQVSFLKRFVRVLCRSEITLACSGVSQTLTGFPQQLCPFCYQACSPFLRHHLW